MTIHNLKAILDSGGTIVKGDPKMWFESGMKVHKASLFKPDLYYHDGPNLSGGIDFLRICDWAYLSEIILRFGNPSEWSESVTTNEK